MILSIAQDHMKVFWNLFHKAVLTTRAGSFANVEVILCLIRFPKLLSVHMHGQRYSPI